MDKYIIIDKSKSSKKNIKINDFFRSNDINQINTDNNHNTFLAYTDGSSFNNHLKEDQRSGGVGVYFPKEDIPNISFTLIDGKISNNVAELTAIKMAIETIIDNSNFKRDDFIKIYTDSGYSKDCLEKYCLQWQNNNWKKNGKSNNEIKNLELIKELWYIYNKYNISLTHIRSHQPEPEDKNSYNWTNWFGNQMSDKLAVNASKKSLKYQNKE